VGLHILRLSGAVPPGRGGELATAVLARTAESGGAATVVLELAGTVEIDAAGRAALCSLHTELRALGTSLRLVVAARAARDGLRGGGLAVHPSMRCAVLAAYAELPGPGLVTPGIRAALAEQPEPLDRTARIALRGWGTAQRPVRELSTP
jgi:anti-anti-sigma regulatory factor